MTIKPWKSTPETCATCAIRHPQTQACQLTGQPKRDDDFCSNHKETLDRCDVCHDLALPLLCFPAEGGYHFLCKSCFEAFSTCRFCAFEADTTLPKQVMQTVRQGNMVMQTQVRNPELVNKTCKAGCKCYDQAGQYCRREDNYCVEHDYQSPF